ncbi:hypothetical protein DIS24_g4918 [Lasiodiplodia hormozganensis]|uniref:F-box domain-containing protein n=1 Tax=Lasiodiplodia hormozganensis TaxID=869390 RepID=A0AA40D0F2_9PEZI|nr:hypothetical protein DIS24_g4918 [Lasiodiplodia hormozganensis]
MAANQMSAGPAYSTPSGTSSAIPSAGTANPLLGDSSADNVPSESDSPSGASSSSGSGTSSQPAGSYDLDLFTEFLKNRPPTFQMSYMGISPHAIQPAFPLLHPDSSQAVRRNVTVPEAVFKMTPRTLLAYTVPEDQTITNVLLERLADHKTPAKFTAYPLLECHHADSLEHASLVAFDSWADSRGIPHARAPPMLNPPATQVIGRLPQEMFDEITGYLSQDDLKSLRLTSRMMCIRATGALFKTIVIPFHSGMFGEELRAELKAHTGKGKGKSMAIDVFKTHGHLVQKFGISYEINEARLVILPKLAEQMLTKSYWGTYYWPTDPSRHDDTPISAVEEVIGMKEAFAEMDNLRELALSINSGLGWLPGPDKSIRSQMVRDRIELFPGAHALPSRNTQAQRELWNFVKSQYAARDQLRELAASRLYKLECADHPAPRDPITYSGIPNELQYVDRQTLMEATVPDGEQSGLRSSNGLLMTARDANHTQSCSSYPVLPASLTQEQIAALRKTRWAQDSLVDAYIIGVIDSKTCRAVKTLNLACLPGRTIEDFNRADFWEALPCLENLKIMVMGEIGVVRQDRFRVLRYDSVEMSGATSPFKSLLMDQIAGRESIKNLHIGWASGGEQAIGLFGRNRHLLPAPFTVDAPVPSPFMMDDIVVFPHVQHLTISNCWMTANALERIAAAHQRLELRKLTLNSISLQVLPRSLGGAMPAMTSKAYVRNAPADQLALDWPFREWSWPRVLDAISPGPNFRLLGKESRGSTSPGTLKEIELVSCGHSALEHLSWNISDLDPEFFYAPVVPNREDVAAYFRSRRQALEPHMSRVFDLWLGSIIQHIPQTESNALQIIWGATIGWQDEDARLAASLDGLRPGGTGRFSAVIRAAGH